MPSRSPDSSLSNQILYLSGRLVSLLGTSIYNFAVVFYVLKLTGSAVSFGLTVILGILPRILLGPLSGTLADRWDKKKIVVGMDLVSAALLFTVFVLAHWFGLSLPLIYVSTLLLTLSNTFFNTAFNAAMPNLVKERELQRLNSLNQGGTALSNIAGPVLGGLIFALVPMELFILVNGFSFALSALSEVFINFHYRLQQPKNSTTGQPEGELQDSGGFRVVWDFLRNNRPLFVLSLYALAINFLLAGVVVAVPYLVVEVLKMPSQALGIIEGAMAVGMILGSLALSLLPPFKKAYKPIIYGLLVMAVGIALLAVPVLPGHLLPAPSHLFLYLSIYIVLGLAMMIVNVPLKVLLQKTTQDSQRGRIFSVLDTFSMAAYPLGVLLFSLFLELTPPFLTPLLSGSVVFLLVVVAAANKELKEL